MPNVEIATEFCKGCGFCIAACPKKVLEIGNGVNAMGYGYAEVANDKCNGCTLCAITCPDVAIEVYK